MVQYCFAAALVRLVPREDCTHNMHVETSSYFVQKLPKGALVIVKGGDMLGNTATLEEHDVEVAFQPPEAISSVRPHITPCLNPVDVSSQPMS